MGGNQIGDPIDLDREGRGQDGQYKGLSLWGRGIQAGGEVDGPVDAGDDLLHLIAAPIILGRRERAPLGAGILEMKSLVIVKMV